MAPQVSAMVSAHPRTTSFAPDRSVPLFSSAATLPRGIVDLPKLAPYRVPADLLQIVYAAAAVEAPIACGRARDVAEIIEATCRGRASRAEAAGARLRVDAVATRASADAQVVEIAVRTLLDIALEAVPRGGVIEVVARERAREHIELAVSYAGAPSGALRARAGRPLAVGRNAVELSAAAVATFDRFRDLVAKRGGRVVIEGSADRTHIRVLLPIGSGGSLPAARLRCA